MDQPIKKTVFENWNRKAIALISAIIVWIIVNQSITESKTIPNIPIKILNLPADKTIIGLLPNGYTSQRVTLTLSGSKDVVRQLEPGDLEVHLDASTTHSDTWVVQINKKQLVSLHPSIDLRHNVTQVHHPELVLKLSPLAEEKVPVSIRYEKEETPQGYIFLNIWPDKFSQSISTAKEVLIKLRKEGLTLPLDFNAISTEELDAIAASENDHVIDEVSFYIPNSWKRITLPFKPYAEKDLNAPEAEQLRIEFLKEELIPINREIPLAIYTPSQHLSSLNSLSYHLQESKEVSFVNGNPVFTRPLYARYVSRRFLDIVREYLALFVIAVPQSERQFLQWSFEVIDSQDLEDTYVAYALANDSTETKHLHDQKRREKLLRKRFHFYLNSLRLFTADGYPLNLICTVEDDEVTVTSE